MINPTVANTHNLWDWDIFKPQANQDSDLLKQIGFIPGLKEILLLRQVHALEHATVWMLSEKDKGNHAQPGKNIPQVDDESLGGLSTDRGFYLYGQVNRFDLQRAVSLALQRLRDGEWHLAVHPRCGTNLSVTMALTFGLILGAHLIFPRGPIEQLVGFGIATTTASQLAPDLGISMQKYITTAIPFNLEVAEITPIRYQQRNSGYFVSVQWRDLQ